MEFLVFGNYHIKYSIGPNKPTNGVLNLGRVLLSENSIVSPELGITVQDAMEAHASLIDDADKVT